MKNIIFLIASILQLSNFSCQEKNNENHEIKNQIEQKNKELAIKAKELAIKQQELDNIKNSLVKEKISLSELYARVKSSVFLIITENNTTTSQGSAFTVSNSGIAISNYHVFKNASKAIAINENGDQFMITEILDYDPYQDYIIFKIGNEANLNFVEISENSPKIGEKCFTVSNPMGLTQTLSEGIISSYRDNQKIIQTTSEITHGSSGAPLFNEEGKVIGITTSGIGEANLNFAININNIPIENYLSNNSIKKSSKRIDQSEIKTLLNNYYNSIKDENWDNLNKLYSNNLKRFYDNFNISKSSAIQSAKEYKTKHGIINSYTSIRWNTLKIKYSNNYTEIEFIMDYKIVRNEKSKPKDFVLNIVMTIDENKQINSVYENIMSKR